MVRRSGGRLQFRRLSLSIHSQLRSSPFGSDFPSNRPTQFFGGHRWRTAWPPSTAVSRHAPEQARDGAEGHRRFRGNTPDAIPGRPYATGDYLTDRNFATQKDIPPLAGGGRCCRPSSGPRQARDTFLLRMVPPQAARRRPTTLLRSPKARMHPCGPKSTRSRRRGLGHFKLEDALQLHVSGPAQAHRGDPNGGTSDRGRLVGGRSAAGGYILLRRSQYVCVWAVCARLYSAPVR